MTRTIQTLNFIWQSILKFKNNRDPCSKKHALAHQKRHVLITFKDRVPLHFRNFQRRFRELLQNNLFPFLIIEYV